MTTKQNQLTEKLYGELSAKYGELMTGGELSKALGYPTLNAFRQAVHRKTVPVKVFSLENRKGKFALTLDIAQWLAEERMKVEGGG